LQIFFFSLGFKATISTLDNAVGHLPTHAPVVIITASFEGEPADNAGRFVEWVRGMQSAGGDDDEQQLRGVAFALFGCGNTEWVTTYQRIPRLLDQLLVEHGAARLVARGEGDAAGDAFFEAFDTWEAHLWEALTEVRAPRSVFWVGPGPECATVVVEI
jgi:cytochrome P450/NADPH-cytochrome P450 reductase